MTTCFTFVLVLYADQDRGVRSLIGTRIKRAGFCLIPDDCLLDTSDRKRLFS